MVIAAQAQAAVVFDITFSDGGVNTGSGEITANLVGGGVYRAVSGTFTISSGGILDPITYNLIPGDNPVAQNIAGSGGLNLSGDNLPTPVTRSSTAADWFSIPQRETTAL